MSNGPGGSDAARSGDPRRQLGKVDIVGRRGPGDGSDADHRATDDDRHTPTDGHHRPDVVHPVEVLGLCLEITSKRRGERLRGSPCQGDRPALAHRRFGGERRNAIHSRQCDQITGTGGDGDDDADTAR